VEKDGSGLPTAVTGTVGRTDRDSRCCSWILGLSPREDHKPMSFWAQLPWVVSDEEGTFDQVLLS
jgi:hypothetical protein